MQCHLLGLASFTYQCFNGLFTMVLGYYSLWWLSNVPLFFGNHQNLVNTNIYLSSHPLIHPSSVHTDGYFGYFSPLVIVCAVTLNMFVHILIWDVSNLGEYILRNKSIAYFDNSEFLTTPLHSCLQWLYQSQSHHQWTMFYFLYIVTKFITWVCIFWQKPY